MNKGKNRVASCAMNFQKIKTSQGPQVGNRNISALVDINRDILIYIFALFLLMPSLFYWLPGHADASVENSAGSTVWQFIELFAFANCFLIARYSNVAPRLVWFSLLPFAAMFVWILLSVSWSEYPPLTIRRGSRLILEAVTFVILALSISTSEGTLRILFRVFLVINLLDVISIAIPSYSQTNLGFAGVHGHKNLAGEFFYLALPVFFIGFLNRSVSRFRSVALCAFVSAAGMLLYTQSKTAMGAIVVATTFSIATRAAFSTRYTRASLLLYFLILVLLVLLVLFVIGVPEVINYVFGDPTLTGRDEIWNYALYKFDGNRLGGVGYGSLWQVGYGLEITLASLGYTFLIINEAHNGYIDTLAQLGIIGLFFLVSFLLMNLIRIYRYFNSEEGRKRLGLADYAVYLFWGSLIYNVTETSFFVSCNMWFVLIFVTTAATGRLAREFFHPRGLERSKARAPRANPRYSKH